MPDRILFPEFRDELEFTRYPFADGATLTADTSQKIETDTFLDACLYPIGSTSRVYLSRIEITTTAATLVLSDVSRKDLATASFELLAPPDVLYFRDRLNRPAGIMVSESLRLARFSAWEVGTHTFALGTTEFVAAVVIPTPEAGVRAIQLDDGSTYAGELWLLGEHGVVLRDHNGAIRIDVVGDPLFVREQCTEVDQFTVPNFIKTINNCPPDPYGNFNLTVGDHFNEQTILRIYADNDGLVIEAVGQTNTQR